MVAADVIPFSACCEILTGITRLEPTLLLADESDAPPLPSGPQMTRRMGKSLAQLLTSRAVLIAVGLAGDGGGRGWMLWIGAVEARRRGGGIGPWGKGWFSLPGLFAVEEVPAVGNMS
jgi:hypothetical protein